MSSQKIEVVKFKIVDGLADWFEKEIQLINKKYGSDVHLRYPQDYPHSNVYAQIEISGSQSQLDDAVEFIRNRSEELAYKMPWLSENTYYVIEKRKKEQVEQDLKPMLIENDTFETSRYTIKGMDVIAFNFRSDVISTKKKEIDEIFKIVAQREQRFIILPKSRVVQNKSFSNISTNILTAFHGSFLKFLSLEDILSLELANKTQNSCYDTNLDHDIQMYLQRNFPRFYGDKKNVDFNAEGFKISEVLRYFIQKYHHCMSNCSDATVLTTNEIQSLSQFYNIQMGWNKLIHIDFKTTNECRFCIVYHSDTDRNVYSNYDTEYAYENHTIIFNDDDSLDQSDEKSKEFSFMVLTSQDNCSPQQTTSVLQWITRHFRRGIYYLQLSKFNLNQVSNQILNGLLNNKFKAFITFYKMNFDLNNLSVVMDQSDHKTFLFKNCQISVQNMNEMSNITETNQIVFEEMDIDLNVFNALKRSDRLAFKYCRLTSFNWEIPINIITGNDIFFQQNTFDILTLFRLLNMLHGDISLKFNFCEMTECDLVDMRHFTVRNTVHFVCMSFNVKTVFQILKYCQFQNQIIFERSHFYFESNSPDTFSLKPIKSLLFCKIRFDSLTLITIFATLHSESEVRLIDCTILSLGKTPDVLNKFIKLRRVIFEDCCLETSTLFSILEISKDTEFVIMSCKLPLGTEIDIKPVPQRQVIIKFSDMKIVPRFVRSLLQTNSEFVFDNCDLNFMAFEFSGIPIQCKSVLFKNNTFNLAKHLKSLADFTSKSGIIFENCHFEYKGFLIPCFMLKPAYIKFKRTTFSPEKLLKILENISEQTRIYFIDCIFPAINWVSSEQNIRIKYLYFREMSLEIRTILCLLKKWVYLEKLSVIDCKIEPNEMNCNTILSTVLVKLERLVFKGVCYSPNLLQILKYLNENCVVKFYGQLSNHEIIELCTKTNVNGKRLKLNTEMCTELIYYELFAEFVRPVAFNIEFDSEKEYDLPTHLLPINFNCKIHDWSTIKIKFVSVNDATVKINFIRNGRPIDFFFESNYLIDASDEFIVDYS